MHFVDDMVVTGKWSVPEQVFAYRLLSLRPDVLTVSLRCKAVRDRTLLSLVLSAPCDLQVLCDRVRQDAAAKFRPRDDVELDEHDGAGGEALSALPLTRLLPQGDWAYPMSLDAHIFRTEDHARLAMSLEYMNPNTLEVPALPSSLSPASSLSLVSSLSSSTSLFSPYSLGLPRNPYASTPYFFFPAPLFICDLPSPPCFLPSMSRALCLAGPDGKFLLPGQFCLPAENVLLPGSQGYQHSCEQSAGV
eukprot:765966-Hanusia_phi.AAC.2